MPPTPSPLPCLRAASRLFKPQARYLPTPLILRTSRTFAFPPLPRSASRTYSQAATRPLTNRSSTSSTSKQQPEPPSQPRPEYELTVTCKPCSTRSTHRISKQGYHHGSVLITCPSCKNRHVIADHLNIFGDKEITIEDLMREQGELVKKGYLGEDGDLEFWGDGTVTSRAREGDEVGKGEPKEIS